VDASQCWVSEKREEFITLSAKGQTTAMKPAREVERANE
jgi:hypothetical protein